MALDSWASVWLKHKKSMPEAYFQDVLQLAHGECMCHKDVSDKGVPIVYVPWSPSKDNIDPFPEGLCGSAAAPSSGPTTCWFERPRDASSK